VWAGEVEVGGKVEIIKNEKMKSVSTELGLFCHILPICIESIKNRKRRLRTRRKRMKRRGSFEGFLGLKNAYASSNISAQCE